MSSSVQESQLPPNAYVESRNMKETGEYLIEKAIRLDFLEVKALLSRLNHLIDRYAGSLTDDRCWYNAQCFYE